MNVESQDVLATFCQAYTLRSHQKWPTNESELAEAFVKHFSIPFLAHVTGLMDFLARANIELIEGDSPDDLLGAYVYAEGKGIIRTSTNPDHVPFQLHTVLHEIREVIETHFKRLGFPTANSSELESRADQFAFWVPICTAVASTDPISYDASEASVGWQTWVSVCLLGVCTLLFSLLSFYGAFGYRWQSASAKRRA